MAPTGPCGCGISPPAALPEDTEPPPKPEPPRAPTYAPPEPAHKDGLPAEALTPEEAFNRRANATGYDLTGGGGGGGGVPARKSPRPVAVLTHWPLEDWLDEVWCQ